MLKTRGERLRYARAKHFKSARAAAAALDMPRATYGAHERAETPGGRDYDPNDAERYGRKFKVTPEWLLTGRGRGPDSEMTKLILDPEAPEELTKPTVKVVGYVGAGAKAHFYAVAQGDLDEVDAPDGATKDTVAVEIRGESLGPLFDRWLVFYDEVRRPITPDLVGHPCVVGLADERVLIKKVKNGHKPGLYHLISATEPPIEDVEIEWAAKVTLMRPR